VLARFDVLRRAKLGNWNDPVEFETPLAKTMAIPDGYTFVIPHIVIPHIVVRGVAAAIAFYGRAFEAEPRRTLPGPDGQAMHGEARIGGGAVMLAAENELWGSKSPLVLRGTPVTRSKSLLAPGGTPVTLSIYVEKCDAAYDRALEAGA